MSVPRSDITWCDFSGGDANPVLRGVAEGDCECSPGCLGCYALALRKRSRNASTCTTYSLAKLRRLGRARFRESALTRGQRKRGEPARPYRRGPGSRPLVFLADMGDLFHQLVPDGFIMDVIGVVEQRSDADWCLRTKRAARLNRMLAGMLLPQNLWVGVTAEDQERADERLPLLSQVSASIRFVSVEPQLEPVDLTGYPSGIHWAVCGGESGPRRRPFDKAWATALYEQCRAAGVPFLSKQGSHRYPGRDDLLDGQRVKQWPEPLGR